MHESTQGSRPTQPQNPFPLTPLRCNMNIIQIDRQHERGVFPATDSGYPQAMLAAFSTPTLPSPALVCWLCCFVTSVERLAASAIHSLDLNNPRPESARGLSLHSPSFRCAVGKFWTQHPTRNKKAKEKNCHACGLEIPSLKSIVNLELGSAGVHLMTLPT